jgi:hypothetical protein
MVMYPDGLPVISAGGAMNLRQTGQRPHDFDTAVDETLLAASDMPPGSECIEALKAAGMRGNVADVFGVVFTKRDRPSR